MYAGKIVICGLAIVTGFGIRSCAKKMGEEVYRGNIKGQEVVYEEGRYPTEINSNQFLLGRKNQMRVKQGNIEYTLIDEDNETSIQHSNFAEDRLERIVIKTDSGIEDLRARIEYKKTLDDIHTKNIFEKGNKLYNNLRGIIKTETESRHRTTEEQFPK